MQPLLTKFLSVFTITLIGFAGSAHAQSIHGVFRVVKGDVKIIQASDKKEVKARLGQKVYPQDVIVAAKDSRAKIIMVDKNELSISPESRVEIQSYEYKPDENKKTVLLNVLYGKVRAKVNQKYEGDNKFQVKTPSAVAGVRGTDFFTSYNRGTNETRVVTFEGRVAFGQPGAGGAIINPVYVAKGESTSKRGNSAPSQPVNVPTAELADIETQSDASKAPDAPSDKRQPAEIKGDKEDKKDEKKEEKKDKSRTPSSASAPGSSMLKEGDFAGAASPNVPPVPPSVGGIPVGPAPVPANMLPPKNDFANEVISGKNKRVIINLTTGP